MQTSCWESYSREFFGNSACFKHFCTQHNLKMKACCPWPGFGGGAAGVASVARGLGCPMVASQRPTAGHSWAAQPRQGHLCEKVFKKAAGWALGRWPRSIHHRMLQESVPGTTLHLLLFNDKIPQTWARALCRQMTSLLVMAVCFSLGSRAFLAGCNGLLQS